MKISNKTRDISISIFIIFLITIFTISLVNIDKEKSSVQTSGSILDQEYSNDNKKISWGIKRSDNNQQPDVGSQNKTILDEYKGICLGNNEKKYVYLTFDEGYEAGYTEKLLETLKQNEIKATFFITAHYLNSQPDLVNKIIEDGHILGNHIPKSLMSGNYKMIES